MPEQHASKLSGAGLGLRRTLLDDLLAAPAGSVDFLELAPENWLGIGGRLGRRLAEVADRYPLVLHGLSLNIGGQAPLDAELLTGIRNFMDSHDVAVYSEHLSYCGDDGHLYELFPLPFTQEAVDHVTSRIQQVQDTLGRPLVLENASYYLQADPGAEFDEAGFIQAVAEASGCELLLDVNNVYVNSVNHGYDPTAFLAGLPLDRVRYLHIAGHYDEAPGLKIDTHGADVPDPVWALLDTVYDRLGPVPTLLERDFNLPPLASLLAETDRIRALQGSRGSASPQWQRAS
jgi:uncharacterized protein (UPF0276 family)